jgi:hypothetical protein
MRPLCMFTQDLFFFFFFGLVSEKRNTGDGEFQKPNFLKDTAFSSTREKEHYHQGMAQSCDKHHRRSFHQEILHRYLHLFSAK